MYKYITFVDYRNLLHKHNLSQIGNKISTLKYIYIKHIKYTEVKVLISKVQSVLGRD
jgi:hypothetical protein